MSISPRFSQPIKVQYILVKTRFNKQALTSTDSHHFDKFVEFIDDSTSHDGFKPFPDNKSDQDISNIHIVKNQPHARLFYTRDNLSNELIALERHVNSDTIFPIYNNGHSLDDINHCRTQFQKAGINDNGCFVFEINHQNLITPIEIQNNIFIHLTQIQFCDFFQPSSLSNVTYYPSVKTIAFEFNTETG